MILNRDELKKRLKEENIVENVPENSIQPAGIDLRIDKIYRIIKSGKLLKDKKIKPEIKEEISETYKVSPREYCLCSTVEKINMPKDLVGIILPRSTLFRIGLSLRTAVVDPGYKGILILGLKNETNHAIEIERYSRICQIIFLRTKRTDGYSGNYQGGKII